MENLNKLLKSNKCMDESGHEATRKLIATYKRFRIIAEGHVAVSKQWVPWKEVDDVHMLFMAHTNTIQKFSPLEQAEIKFKIAKVIMEAEVKHLQETKNITSSEDSNIDVLEHTMI